MTPLEGGIDDKPGEAEATTQVKPNVNWQPGSINVLQQEPFTTNLEDPSCTIQIMAIRPIASPHKCSTVQREDPLQINYTEGAFGSEHEATLLKRRVVKAMGKSSIMSRDKYCQASTQSCSQGAGNGRLFLETTS